MSAVIAAIDPGPLHSGYVVFDGSVRKAEYLANDVLLARLQKGELRMLGAKLCIEMVANYGMPAGRELFETCVWIGRFREASGVECSQVYRKTVCGHICNDGKAKDANIRQALIDRFGPPSRREAFTPMGKTGPLKERTRLVPGPTAGITGDMWAALALAVYGWDSQRGLRCG